MEIKMLRTINFEDTLNDLCRRTAPLSTDAKSLISILEGEGAESPLIIFVAGVRSGVRPGDWNLREVRKLLIYQSRAFLKIEKERLEEEKKAAVQAARQARLNEIKAGLRKERLADDRSFDGRYDEQTKKQLEAEERAIEEKAAMILAKEENK